MSQPSTPRKLNSIGQLGRKSWQNLRSKLSPGSGTSSGETSPRQFVVLSPHLDLYERRVSAERASISITEPANERVEPEQMPDQLPDQEQSQHPQLTLSGNAMTLQGLGEPFREAAQENGSTYDSESDGGSAFSFDRPFRQRSYHYYKPESSAETLSSFEVNSLVTYDSEPGSALDDDVNVWDELEDLSHLDPDGGVTVSPPVDAVVGSVSETDDAVLDEINMVQSDDSLEASPVLRRAKSDSQPLAQVIRTRDRVTTLFGRTSSTPARTTRVPRVPTIAE